jgi:MSHA biogenesis protein MshP
MKCTSTTFRRQKRQRGFAMAVVIAILAGVAVFGVSIVVVSTTQQAGATLDLEGARAYYAARGALEWGVYHVLRPGFGGCAGIHGKSVTYGGNLAGFRATLACTSSVHEEGSANVTLFAISATACNDAVACPTASAPPPAYYVARQVRVTVGSN